MNKKDLREKLLSKGYGYFLYDSSEPLEDGTEINYYNIYKNHEDDYYPDYAIKLANGEADWILEEYILGYAKLYECEVNLSVNNEGKIFWLEKNCKQINIETL
ncbi:MAG: hypothetical protein ACK5AO_04545 [bacterium]|jgi:hypothetical protein